MACNLLAMALENGQSIGLVPEQVEYTVNGIYRPFVVSEGPALKMQLVQTGIVHVGLEQPHTETSTLANEIKFVQSKPQAENTSSTDSGLEGEDK